MFFESVFELISEIYFKVPATVFLIAMLFPPDSLSHEILDREFRHAHNRPLPAFHPGNRICFHSQRRGELGLRHVQFLSHLLNMHYD
jgi:hypothetical protein